MVRLSASRKSRLGNNTPPTGICHAFGMQLDVSWSLSSGLEVGGALAAKLGQSSMPVLSYRRQTASCMRCGRDVGKVETYNAGHATTGSTVEEMGRPQGGGIL